MSSLPEQAQNTDHEQRAFQANIDKREFRGKENNRDCGKGRPIMKAIERHNDNIASDDWWEKES